MLPYNAIITTTDSSDKVQRVAGEHGYSLHPTLHVQPDLTVAAVVAVPEAVDAGIAVCQGGAGPRLGVAHVPLERRRSGGAEVLQLVQRAGQLVHRVGNLDRAVTHRDSLPLVGPQRRRRLQLRLKGVEVSGEGASVGEGNPNGGLSEV